MARAADLSAPGALPAIAAPSAIAGVRRFPAGLVFACLSLGCASSSSEPLPLVAVPAAARVELSAPDGGPAARLGVRVLVSTLEGGPIEVLGIREDVATPAEASLLDLDVAWTDFQGDGPRSIGRSQRFVLPYVRSGTALAGAPLAVDRIVELPPAPGMLARRVTVRARLIGIDLRQERGHTGGTLLTLPEAVLESFAPGPPGTLALHLQSRSVPGIFLSAASAPAELREDTLAELIRALPATPEPARGAIFAALLYLTGETHGRDIYRWSSWWKARAAATGPSRAATGAPPARAPGTAPEPGIQPLAGTRPSAGTRPAPGPPGT